MPATQPATEPPGSATQSWRSRHQGLSGARPIRSQLADGDRLGTEAVAMSRMGDGDQRLGALT